MDIFPHTWRVPVVGSCCYCVTLRTGAKLFGFISLLGCMLIALLSISKLSTYAQINRQWYEEAVWELSADILVQTIQMGTSVMLILGVYQEKGKLIIPWLVTCVINAVLEVLFLPSFYVRIFNVPDEHLYQWILINVAMLVDDIYGWLVVFSYYRTLIPQDN